MSVQVKGSGTIGGIDEGLVVSGIVTATELDISGNIDVDGHTNLDNVNIAGVTTSTGNIYADNYFGNSGLTLNNNGNPSINLTSNSTTGSSRINFGDPDSNSVGLIHYVHDGDYFKFQTAYNERLRITSDGKVGVGTNTFIDGSTNFEVRGKTANTSAGGQNIHKYGSASAFHYGQFNSSGDASLNNQANANLLLATNNTERLRATSDGRISINDSSPTSQETLTIKPNGNIACDVSLKMNTNTDSRIKFYDSGGTWRGGFAFTEYANSTDYPNFHDSFYFLTDPSSNGSLSTAMRINNAGCFMYPKQPCFSVAMSSDYTSSTTHTANFDTERFDQGNNFNTGSNGIFTAPVTGKYYMHAAIQTMQHGGSQVHIMGVAFLVNGSVQSSKGSGDQYLGRNGDHYITVHCIRILNLAQGDTVQVYIQLHGAVRIEGSGGTDRCNWQGYLMA